MVARAWFNPNFEPLWSAVPSLFAGLTAFVGFMVSALAIARERELGTFEQLLVTPLRPVEILAGKTVPALLVALVGAAMRSCSHENRWITGFRPETTDDGPKGTRVSQVSTKGVFGGLRSCCWYAGIALHECDSG